ncbi:hypothetical protein CXG81DRAFT_12907 [Caulochytrium protostelioides]|uniref:Cytochrome b5 heme-binding domain-containing protein n=1 Tax=Caulochytrium protostelioides TaxID=1555241 RepID=A0A4P9X6A0_9FUNG|nr:hypothetical protein CXG81DRAFT_12907 [Caulochytrium protostelioides]|eukprot:RKP00707.1 hypothetical protein CXG81DRAFT_12907 [Caulochytrium protostelioides]
MPPASAVRTFTWEEIRASTKGASAKQPRVSTKEVVRSSAPRYIVIHRKVYDVSGDFVAWHPGGEVALTQLGEDASGAFDAFHTEAATEILANYYVGDLDPSEPTKHNAFVDDLSALRARLENEGQFCSSKAFFFRKFVEVCLISALAWTLLYRGQGSVLSMLAFGVLTGLFWQQTGWLSHDVLHHQLWTSRRLNHLTGTFLGNVLQGLSIGWWGHKHSNHHSTPNVHLSDPDIDTMPFLAWSEMALELFNDVREPTAAAFMVSHQPILYFPLLGLARMSWAYQSIIWQFAKGRIDGDTSAAGIFRFPTATVLELAGLILHWTWNIVGVWYCVGWVRTLPVLFFSQIIGGILLAVVFSLNHNGMKILTREESQITNHYELAVVTGRNVHGSALSTWFTGGLNYQIEHHMFPTLPRHRLSGIAEEVHSLCKKHHVPYHSTGLFSGLAEVVNRLARISQEARRRMATNIKTE